MWNSLAVVRRREALWSGSYFFDAPVVDEHAIYCCYANSALVRLDRRTLRDVWRVDGQGRYLYTSLGNQLLLTDWRLKRTSAVAKDSGATTWSITREPWLGVRPWKDVLLLFSDAIEVLDPATGQCLDRFQIPGGAIRGQVQVCRDLLLVVPDEPGPIRAFDLTARALLWERDLIAEAESRFAIKYENRLIAFAPASRADLLIVSRGAGGVLGCRRPDGELVWGVHVPMIHQWNTISVRGYVHVLHFGRSYVIDEESGRVVAAHDYDDVFGRAAWRAWEPVAHDDLVAYTMESSHVAVFRVPGGELVSWAKYKYGLGRPAIAAPYLIALGADGWLVCFGEPSEREPRRRRRTSA